LSALTLFRGLLRSSVGVQGAGAIHRECLFPVQVPPSVQFAVQQRTSASCRNTIHPIRCPVDPTADLMRRRPFLLLRGDYFSYDVSGAVHDVGMVVSHSLLRSASILDNERSW
jgi:hypothetical protein